MQQPANAPPLILVMDTSTDHACVGIARGAEVLAWESLADREQTSALLIHRIGRVIEKADTQLPSIDLYSAVSGPGSFTGLRVGLATIKGLARAHRRPAVSLTSLECTALLAGDSPLTCVLLNGRRDEVFTQSFTVEGETVTPLDAPRAVGIEQRLGQLRHSDRILFAGDGCALYRAALEREASSRNLAFARWRGGEMGGGFAMYDGPLELAGAIARLAMSRFLAGRAIESSALDAFYVRSSDAELKLKRARE